MEQECQKTCLHDRHVALGALMSPFAGFDMPIQYAGITEEHNAVRQHVGVFDVSHMGEVRVSGPDAYKFVSNAENILHGCLCLGTLYRHFSVIRTLILDSDIESLCVLKNPRNVLVYIGGVDFTRKVWDKLMKGGVQPCGLGCRDTLRFEVGLPLYGDELSADITPIEASLSMFVKLDKPEFIGKEALAAQKAEGVKRRIVGLELEGNAIPRHGYPVEVNGEQVGEITTGYRSISTGKSVAMAMINKPYDKLGTEVEVRIRKKTFPAKVVKKRFYDKNYKK